MSSVTAAIGVLIRNMVSFRLPMWLEMGLHSRYYTSDVVINAAQHIALLLNLAFDLIEAFIKLCADLSLQVHNVGKLFIDDASVLLFCNPSIQVLVRFRKLLDI